MKNKLAYLIFVTMLCTFNPAYGQQCATPTWPQPPCFPNPPDDECGGSSTPKSFKVDISTGIDDATGKLMPVFAQDDNWRVIPPPTPCNLNPGYMPAKCSNYRIHWYACSSGTVENFYCETPYPTSGPCTYCASTSNGPGHDDICPNDPTIIGGAPFSYKFFSGPAFFIILGDQMDVDCGNLDRNSRLIAPSDLLKCPFGHISQNYEYGKPWTCPEAGTWSISPTVPPFNDPSPTVTQSYPPYSYVWTYEGQFYLPSYCSQNASSVKLNFEFIGGGNLIEQIDVQGFPYPVVATNNNQIRLDDSNYHNYYPLNEDNRCQSLNIPVSQFTVGPGGHISIKVYARSRVKECTGLIINGNIEVEVQDFVDFTLKDKTGNKSGTFCVGDDIFLDGSNSNLLTNNYTLKLYDGNGTQLVPPVLVAGTPAWVNLKSIFNTVNFVPGVTYSVSLGMSGACGNFETGKKFTVNCCNSSYDASFDLKINDSKLIVNSTLKNGTHSWEIYGASNSSAGPYSPYIPPGGVVLNGYGFSVDLPSNPAPCYLIKHTLTNTCAATCKEQSICNLTCDMGDCILSSPVLYPKASANPSYLNGTLTWNIIPGAISYVIETVVNGCAQCGPPDGSLANVHSTTIPADPSPTNSYTLTQNDFSGYDGIPGCFLIRIYAVCPDGSLSLPSNYICSK